ncbi:unnamed protein product [Closterium sp. Yama58-4]|nr:unnamed protein product [Closterium sp. Yama58-4]
MESDEQEAVPSREQAKAGDPVFASDSADTADRHSQGSGGGSSSGGAASSSACAAAAPTRPASLATDPAAATDRAAATASAPVGGPAGAARGDDSAGGGREQAEEAGEAGEEVDEGEEGEDGEDGEEGEEGGEGEVRRTLWFPLNVVAAAASAVAQSRVARMVAAWPLWQQRRRLRQLLEAADSSPGDARRQAEYLAELLRADPGAVVQRFEARQHAVDAEGVAVYLRALVATDRLSSFLPSNHNARPSSLPLLLEDLKQRATSDEGQLGLPPGTTEQTPLHVVMVEREAKPLSRGLRWLQELLSALLACFFGLLIWAAATTALRRYASGVAGMGGAGVAGGPAAGMGAGGAGVYSPKEYNKENMPEKSVRTFKDVRGCDEAKAELEEIVEYLRDPDRFTRLGGKLPKGVLLIGPPGTGKTLLAKAIAGEAGVPFFYRAGSEFEEMFVGVGARRVRTLFQAAKKKAPCIVFIDEIDAVGGSRKQWEGHSKKTLNQLLVEMDGFEPNEGIIVMAATNVPDMLDPALTRPGRFDRHVVVSAPDVRGRREILELYLEGKPLHADVDVATLAKGTPGFSGADLANLVNMAAVKAALDGVAAVGREQLEFAKDKILMGAERRSLVLSQTCRKNTAYHESGHALVALHTPHALPIHKATIMPRGAALGMVTQMPDDDFETSRTRAQMLARLDVCMGGRVAEELVFGVQHVTSGARDDLRQATRLARQMVRECGMSDKLGPVFIESDGAGEGRVSGEVLRVADAEVARLLREAYARVTTLLKQHEQQLHVLAGALLERETMTADDIKKLLASPATAAAVSPTATASDGDDLSRPLTPADLQALPSALSAAPAAFSAASPPSHDSAAPVPGLTSPAAC